MRKWLNKGEGGEWYEPYVSNRDLVFIGLLTLVVSLIIIGGCLILNSYERLV